jgi:hypothetical protein
MYDMEGYFMIELLTNTFENKLSKISDKICSIEQYKKGFEVVSKFLMFEEEGMV